VVLSDRDLLAAIATGQLGLDPFDKQLLQPASIDVRLDHRFRVFNNHRYQAIDPKLPMEDLTELVEVEVDTPFILHPREFVLAATAERVTLGDGVVARLEGKSSLGRLGLVIHSTAGFIDPGFDGHVTLELSNLATLPIKLYPGMPIGQLSVFALKSGAEHPYGQGATGSKYQGQVGPTPSSYYKNFQ
jgi:dCTP deaminase